MRIGSTNKSQISGRTFKLLSEAKAPEKALELSYGIFHRLMDERNVKLRNFVHELTLQGHSGLDGILHELTCLII